MPKQNVYIDGLGLVEGHFSGIGQYILGILRGLDELLEDAKYNDSRLPRITVIVPRDKVARFKSFQFRNIGYKSFPLPFRYMAALWHRGKLPPIDLICGRGTYIFPRFVDMPLLFSKSALVIYDLSYELHREYSDEGNARFLSKGVRRSVGRSKQLITISENARREIIDFYKVKPAEVKLAYPATDPRIFYRRSSREIDRAKSKYEISGDYILALSNLEPRKNLQSLVDAYCALPKAITERYALLLVGVSGWKTERLFNEIVKRVDEGYNIIRPSHYVSDEDKAAIISGASLLVYPSHYEGFGMPPVEALACGVPVIAADNSSLPEAVGTAGELVDVAKKGALLKALLSSLGSADELQRKTLVDGPQHARSFSWKDSAQVFLDSVTEIQK